MEVIIIKYAELNTKKNNKNYFINTLKNNIKRKISDDYEIKYTHGRMFIYGDNLEELITPLENTFGIYEFTIAKVSSYDDLDNEVIKYIKDKDFDTFRVTVDRYDKNFKETSMQLARSMGGVVLKNKDNIKVDLHNADFELTIELRDNKAYIYHESYKGKRGFPSGTTNSATLMLSGGLDSPVAGYLALRKGLDIKCIYFDAPPYTSENALNKVIDLAKLLNTYSGNVELYVVKFTKIQEEIKRKTKEDYIITLMRKLMYKVTNDFTLEYGGTAIITGESIGQVASQTLTSMRVISSNLDLPVIRPLATYDKEEIIKISKEIDAYDISILPYDDLCGTFIPKHPVINPTMEQTDYYVSQLEVDDLIKNIDIRKIDLKEKKNKLL